MWREVATIFWKLAKTSDMRQRFDNDFALITDKIATVLGDLSEKKKQDTEQWLESLRSRKESWAACYTWQHCLYGIHSTQRAESMHRVVADFCRKSHTIGEIAHLLEYMAANQEMKSEMQMLKQEMTAQIHGREDEPFLEYIVQKHHGLGENIGINDYIPHCTTLTSCSCQFPQCYGLPCRHIIRVLFDIASAVDEAFFPKALDMVVVRKWIKSHSSNRESFNQQVGTVATGQQEMAPVVLWEKPSLSSVYCTTRFCAKCLSKGTPLTISSRLCNEENNTKKQSNVKNTHIKIVEETVTNIS